MTHASLFSGIGGPEVAAAMMGWDNVFHCEINPFGRSILDYWFPESESYEDITKTDFTKHRGQIDVLTGGFPCQPFSYAGKRGGQTDDRYLWPEMLRVIDEIRPTWVIGENVAGITTMVESCEITDLGGETSLFEEDNGVHRFRAEHTFTIERICRDLESKGYSVQPMLIPACAVGAPHRRDRVFIIAHNTDCGDDLREAGEDARKSWKERISERNEVWEPGESDNVRQQVLGLIEDTLRDGCQSGHEKEQRDMRDIRNAGARDSKWICGEERADSSNANSRRGSEVDKHLQSEFSDGAEPVCDGRVRNVADTNCGGLERSGEGRRQRERDNALWQNRSLLPGEIWKGFPSVSPVHRGNDGLPFDVDNLTISFSKWRNESLKAYGNAIVPQVMYRIFQCIEETERSWK